MNLKNHIKNNKLAFWSIVFFIVVNMRYFWEGMLGLFTFPVYFTLLLVFLILLIRSLLIFVEVLKERFSNKKRNSLLMIMVFVLSITAFYPSGIIDFDALEGKDILIANRKGTANCSITLQLKDTGIFIETDVCFGLKKNKGSYSLSNDTIYFNQNKRENNYYEYGVITPVFYGKSVMYNINLFKNREDSISSTLRIYYNKLHVKIDTSFQAKKAFIQQQMQGELTDYKLRTYYPSLTDTIQNKKIFASAIIKMKVNDSIIVSILHNAGDTDQIFLCTHNLNKQMIDKYYIGKATQFENAGHTIEYKIENDSVMIINHEEWVYNDTTNEVEMVKKYLYSLLIDNKGNIYKNH